MDKKMFWLSVRIAAIVLIIIVLVAIDPFVTIWMLNTLFKVGIAYTWQTWTAALLLSVSLYRYRGGGKK